MKEARDKLIDALDEVRKAKACIAQNRGYEKEQAREGYDAAVCEVLIPAIEEAFTVVIEAEDPKRIVRIANFIRNELNGAINDAAL